MTELTMKEAVNKVVEGKNLTRLEASTVMDLMLSGRATEAQIAAFLVGLRMKGETMDEIVGLAQGLSDKAEHIQPNADVYVDLVGTGGDRTFTFNVSTTSSMVVSAAGLPVAKHGNRSISSKSGSADVLEELGVDITISPDKVTRCVDEVGIGFMFAQTFIKAMKYVGKVRSEMGIRSVFNILGPLSNPSNAKYTVIGVYDPALTETLAMALNQLGVKRCFCMSGEDHMDEFTLTGKTTVAELNDGHVKVYEVTPEQFGFKRCTLDELRGGDKTVNAQITRDILTGKLEGPMRDMVLLNAGATLYIGGKADSIEQGINIAADTIDSGKAYERLMDLVKATAA